MWRGPRSREVAMPAVWLSWGLRSRLTGTKTHRERDYALCQAGLLCHLPQSMLAMGAHTKPKLAVKSRRMLYCMPPNPTSEPRASQPGPGLSGSACSEVVRQPLVLDAPLAANGSEAGVPLIQLGNDRALGVHGGCHLSHRLLKVLQKTYIKKF